MNPGCAHWGGGHSGTFLGRDDVWEKTQRLALVRTRGFRGESQCILRPHWGDQLQEKFQKYWTLLARIVISRATLV